MRMIAIGVRRVPLAVVQSVEGGAWRRMIEPIDQVLLERTVNKVAKAVSGSELELTDDEKNRTERIFLLYA